MVDEDARDLAIHASIEHLVTTMCRVNGFSRREALDRLEAFIENDEPQTSVLEEVRA